MNLHRICLAIPLALALSSCVVVPEVDRYQDTPPDCKTYTKSMSLKTVDRKSDGVVCADEGCLAAFLVISAGSVLISGSIVLAGNTLHWLEYQGTCSDGYLNTTKQLFLKSINKPGATPEA